MKILVIQTAYPGDAILTLPLIQELNKKYKKSIVDVLCIPSTKILFEASPYVNNVIVYDKKNEHKGLVSFVKMIKTIRVEKYFKIYSPHRSARSALLTFFANPAESISFDKSTLSFLYKHKVKYHLDWHEVRRNLSLLRDSYNDTWRILPELNIAETIKIHVGNLMQGTDYSKLILIAPGSVWNTKKYPPEYFKKIIIELINNGYQLALIGGNEDRDLADSIIPNNAIVNNLCGQLNFLHSIYLIKKSCLLICNDSAPTHLAMAADSAVLTLFCSTVPDFGFYPYNSKSKFLSYNDLDCKPCGIHGFSKCPQQHFRCGFELTPESVLQVVYSMLGQRHSLHN